MGMDWHSSGITTSVIGALKRGLRPLEDELGVHVCGGRGKHSRRTPDELISVGERVGFDGAALAQTSRLVAKVDSAAVQDGFDLYLHGFIVTDDAKWVVVQQGMNGERRQARRYHWLSEDLKDFVDEPHSAIEGHPQGRIINLTHHRAAASRCAQIELLGRLGPDAIAGKMVALSQQNRPKPTSAPPLLPHLIMPGHHEIRADDVAMRRLRGTLAAAANASPRNFTELLLVQGVGARTVWALAMVAELVHGAPCRFSDPARYSFAHGGKDRHPFPVPLTIYDETIRVLKSAVQNAKLGREDALGALRRLDEQARRLESLAKSPTFEELIAEENRRSFEYGGRSVLGRAKPPSDSATSILGQERRRS
jgi:hypothetical protein